MTEDSERSTIYNSLTMEDYIKLTRALDALPEIRNNLVSIAKSLEYISSYLEERWRLHEEEGSPL